MFKKTGKTTTLGVTDTPPKRETTKSDDNDKNKNKEKTKK